MTKNVVCRPSKSQLVQHLTADLTAAGALIRLYCERDGLHPQRHDPRHQQHLPPSPTRAQDTLMVRLPWKTNARYADEFTILPYRGSVVF